MARHDRESRRRTARRPARGPEGNAEMQQRGHLAQVAARLIAEHGIADWGLARRKAAHQLMLGDRALMPGDDEIESALLEHQTLFGGAAHAAVLRDKREEALRWMRRLEKFSPTLFGGVAAGWATIHSDIRLELIAADAKAVELALLGKDQRYRAMPMDRDGAAELWIDTPFGGLRLSVRTTEDVRHRPLRDRHGRLPARLGEAALRDLLNAADP